MIEFGVCCEGNLKYKYEKIRELLRGKFGMFWYYRVVVYIVKFVFNVKELEWRECEKIVIIDLVVDNDVDVVICCIVGEVI